MTEREFSEWLDQYLAREVAFRLGDRPLWKRLGIAFLEGVCFLGGAVTIVLIVTAVWP